MEVLLLWQVFIDSLALLFLGLVDIGIPELLSWLKTIMTWIVIAWISLWVLWGIARLFPIYKAAMLRLNGGHYLYRWM
jgi:hypothetical protein